MKNTELRLMRKASGLTQKEAGKLVNLTEGSFAVAESGKFKMDAAKRELFEIKTQILRDTRKQLGL